MPEDPCPNCPNVRVRVVSHKSGRHPMVIGLLLAMAFLGMFFLVGSGPSPSSINNSLDPLFRKTWAATLALSSITALIGMYRGNPVSRALLEMTGKIGLASALLVYSGALLYTNGKGALLPGVTYGVIGISCFVRSISLVKEVRAYRPERVRKRGNRWRGSDS